MNQRIVFSYSLLVCCVAFIATAQTNTYFVPSEAAPNITASMSIAKQGDTVKVKDGTYKENVHVNPGVILVAENLLKAVINGGGRGTVVTLSTGSVISGFEVRNGTIGVFSTSAQAEISRCRIINNQQSGILCVGHLPKIQDNIIAYNRGSGIQGWDVRTTNASINHNTISYNSNNGIALGGNSNVTIENNIIAFNDQFGVKPSEEDVRMELINNSFYNNTKFTGVLPTGNVSHDPMFIDAKRVNFNMQRESKCIGMGDNNQNLGARLVY